MASNTKKTELRRIRKKRASGKERKRALRHGSTPAFPIHKEAKSK